ncbi:MAG: excinuclease ABC subunit UvrC [Bradyrhizobium sp.]|nr:MAG: excinuclease ABC subunit UvrC [Bradyrhizobium sp.]
MPLDFALDEAPAEPGTLARGAGVVKSFWRHAPMGPGVYRMIGGDGEVLYVGKARSIKKRVQAYTTPERQSIRIARMVAQTCSMVFVTTETEAEALLLEANLIKQLKPRYNVLLRDDKSFPYILIAAGHAAPRLVKHRGARSTPGDYFGPFANAGAVSRTLNALQRAFLLRTCSDSYYDNRTRPCLLYQIKRCSAPCTGEIGPAGYAELVGEARDFLSGRSRAIRQRLAREMTGAAETLEYEKAARLRDRISALSTIQGEQSVNPRSVPEADVFAIVEEAGQFCIEAFFFRTYQNWGNRAYFPRADRSLGPAEVLDSFLAQFYLERPAPRLVLLNCDVASAAQLQEILGARAGHRIAVGAPRRGEKKELVDMAARNARQALSRRLAEAASQTKLLAALAVAFGLAATLRRVEVYDNSHIMGTNAIGAMIVAGPEGFVKNQYRTFNIKSAALTPGDDYAMMREVLSRRFARLLKDEGQRGASFETPAAQAPQDEEARATETHFAETRAAETSPRPEEPAQQASRRAREGDASFDSPAAPAAQHEEDAPDAFPDRPDLVIIDGGRGQLEAARQVLSELGVAGVALASIAKGPDRNAGRETFFIPGRPPFKLSPRDPALFFVQRLRDEAHRFAIGTHRARRKKDFVKSPLDEITGIGPARKRALLHAFGSAKDVAQAGLADLEKTPGLNAATARRIYDFFHDGGGE